MYIGYLAVQYLIAGYLLGWSLVYKSRMTPSYLLSTAGGIAIMYFLCARGYKAVVWWLLIIAVSVGVILDTLLLNSKAPSQPCAPRWGRGDMCIYVHQ